MLQPAAGLALRRFHRALPRSPTRGSPPFPSDTPGVSQNPMFPALNGSRTRYFQSKNRVIAGILITQTRVELGTCDEIPSVADLQDVRQEAQCQQLDNANTEPFGTDPTFMETSGDECGKEGRLVCTSLFPQSSPPPPPHPPPLPLT